MEDREELRAQILNRLIDEDLRKAFTVEEAVALQFLRNLGTGPTSTKTEVEHNVAVVTAAVKRAKKGKA